MGDNIIQLKSMGIDRVRVRIEGISPLVVHAFPAKAREDIRGRKVEGRKRRNRDIQDPETIAEEGTYRLASGAPGFPAAAIAKSVRSACSKDMGYPRTYYAKSVFAIADEGDFCEIHCSSEKVREDVVRVASGGTDLRWRRQFDDWYIDVTFEYDTEWMSKELLVELIQRAGFGIGIGEGRPEKSSELGWGRFRVGEIE